MPNYCLTRRLEVVQAPGQKLNPRTIRFMIRTLLVSNEVTTKGKSQTHTTNPINKQTIKNQNQNSSIAN